jgi:CO dehydrogenase maturation factor
MSKIIAITGKGGVGKTTISGLMVTRLIANNCRPVLAVDADPNTCLDIALGISAEKTVGGIREEAREIAGKGMASGISKQQLLELKIAESLVEGQDFDYIAMGRPEGPGCYCYANNVLKEVIKEIAAQYPYVILDNEAGLENLSRRIVQNVDILIFVADSSRRGLDTILRLHSLTKEMGIQYDQLAIIVNRLRRSELSDDMLQLKSDTGSDILIGLPDNEEIALVSENGENFFNLSEENEIVQQIDDFLLKLN